ncbi:MAG: hypothetical protein FWD78_00155 [Treponema sp.]|nr:hypothetical protein [Treponema sp.]
MKKKIIILLVLTIFIFSFTEACKNPFFPGLNNNTAPKKDGTGRDEGNGPFGKIAWVKTIINADGESDTIVEIYSIAVDSKGNVYLLGTQNKNPGYIGESGAAAGTRGGYNWYPVLVKYSAQGSVIWVKIITENSAGLGFNALAIDPEDNIYIAGFQQGNNINYKDGVFSKGLEGTINSVVVKYNSNGITQWVYTAEVDETNQGCGFYALAITAGDKVHLYAAGYQAGESAYTYGKDVSAAGGSSGYNPVLVKLDTDGKAYWAKTLEAPEETDPEKINTGNFVTVTTDRAGYVYAAGNQYGICNFGNGVITNNQTDNISSLLVKYDSNGEAQWGTTSAGTGGDSFFKKIIADEAGNIYAAGHQAGFGVYSYGSGILASGANIANNHVLVKYDSNGNTCWAKTLEAIDTAEPGGGGYVTITADKTGHLYTAGIMYNGPCNFGDGAIAENHTGKTSPVLVKYDTGGNTIGVWNIKESPGIVFFQDIAIDHSSGYLYAVGNQMYNLAYEYDESTVVTGKYNQNPVLVKFYR